MIDLVEIRKQIKNGIFTTYFSKGNIYLKNNRTGEQFIIGSYIEIEEKYYVDGKMFMSKISNLPNKELGEVNE